MGKLSLILMCPRVIEKLRKWFWLILAIVLLALCWHLDPKGAKYGTDLFWFCEGLSLNFPYPP